jgi:hypothetical protein
MKPDFAWWDDKRSLLLISREVFVALPDGTVLGSVMGDTKIKGMDTLDDKETRFGMLAYGFKMPNFQEEAQKRRDETRVALFGKVAS